MRSDPKGVAEGCRLAHDNQVWLREGKLQGVKVGRLWRVTEGAVNEFIAKGRGNKTDKAGPSMVLAY